MSSLNRSSRRNRDRQNHSHQPMETLERRSMMSATPAANAPANPPRDHIVIEAEKSAVDGGKIVTTGGGYTGAGYVDFVKGGDYVEFTINAPVAGQYALGFRYANGNAAAQNVGVAVNGVAKAGGVEFITSGTWNAWQIVSAGATLKAGVNKIRLTGVDASAPHIDHMGVRRMDPVDGPGRYEAESGKVATVKGAVVSTQHAGFHNKGYVDFVNASGDYLEFKVTAHSGGTYALDFRYANGGAGARKMGLKIDGKDVAGGVAFAATGSWTTWKVATVTVNLTPGTHTIRLTATGQSGPNVDWLTTEGIAFPAAKSAAPATPPTASLLTTPPTRLAGVFSAINVGDDQPDDVLAA